MRTGVRADLRPGIDYIVTDAGCWEWQGAINVSGGYAMVHVGGRLLRAHRYSYERFVGPIPDGLTIDHLCRNPPCINPAHLEPVTQQVNNLRGETPSGLNARKTHCPQGHAYDAENTFRAYGRRYCRACRRKDVA